MTAKTDVEELLKNMQPYLDETRYVFCSVEPEVFRQIEAWALGVFHEAEGVTLILEESQAASAGLTYDGVWARLTLRVHSSLKAVGFLAAITAKFANEGLSMNPVSAFHHDHLFVQWEYRAHAMEVLLELQRAYAQTK